MTPYIWSHISYNKIMMAKIKLKLHENVLIISDRDREGYDQEDMVVYIPEKDIEEKIERSYDITSDVDSGIIEDLEYGYIGILIAEMKNLLKKAQNYYYRLEEKNKIQTHFKLDEFFPMVIITFYILKQIKIILRTKALGHIANDIEKDELNIAWNLFQYLLKGMPAGSELLNKLNKEKFMDDYVKVFMLR